MRRDLVIALAGGAVILLASVGLVTGALREGPLDGELVPVGVDVHVTGTYAARAASDLNGLCLQPPCEARTVVDLTFHGLPSGDYEVHLEGADARNGIGTLSVRGDEGTFWLDEAADHTDKDTLELTWIGDTVLALPVRANDDMDVDRQVAAQLETASGTYHANEIGGVSVSTVVEVGFPSEPPPQGRYRAWFEGLDGWTDLGVLDSDDSGSSLDARIERLRLEDQDRLVVYLEPAAGEAAAPVGWPVLQAEL